ncbi:hypothetical protein ACFLRI_01805 [Bacteroidota bacterium]
MRSSISFLIILLIASIRVFSQDTNYILAKITVDSWENPRFNDAIVIWTDIISREQKIDTTQEGLCELKLNLKTSYLLEVRHPDFYTKAIEVETGVPKKELHKAHTLYLEVLLKKNCDENPAKAKITDEPIGRVAFDKNQKKFQYDYDITYKMGEKYEEIRKERCRLVEERKKEAKRLADEQEKARKLAEKQAAEFAEQQRVVAEKARIDSIYAAEKMKEQDQLAEINQKRIEREEQEQRLKEEEERFRLERENREAEERRLAEEEKEAKKREPKFDENRETIFIYPKNSWASTLANSISDPGEERGAIGTFTYSITEGRTDFYVEDAEELRQKFPKEFDNAFPNWDYVVDVNMKYIKGQ